MPPVAPLREADLQEADLREADLREADRAVGPVFRAVHASYRRAPRWPFPAVSSPRPRGAGAGGCGSTPPAAGPSRW
ncbi:pentapeptide repeat-containing protein [Streptomyces hygroscopicus]|uniref:pentapeptide repeat-containing protein n=1 Tax=Streptomyces hygroscopicus TaxID=1912 RepID=UPI0035563CE5